MPNPAAPSPPGRFTAVGVLALTVLVFGAVVAVVTWQQHAGLREQILRREAETLGAVAAMQLNLSAEEMGEAVADVPGALLVAVLKASKLSGVVGVRVFDAKRVYNSADGVIGGAEPPAENDWARLLAGVPITKLHARPPGEEIVFVQPLDDDARLIEAWVPLRRTGSPEFLGAAQFWLDGDQARAELAAHDQRLWIQAGVAWLAGSLVIGATLLWAFRRLSVANRQLRMRSEDLLRANRELVLAAKTSALGAVTAHLMHELKNPIAGLEVFVAGQADAATRGESGGELAAASELTRRLRTMVNDVVGVLRDEQGGAAFELTSADVVEVVREKVRADAAARGIALETSGVENVSLSGRRANLAVLVLRNLLQNALEATPAGGVVQLRGVGGENGAAEFFVEDSGPGLATGVRARLFQPCGSTKPGGSGIGLALSYQLAQQAGGRLELVRSDERGTSFRLVLGAEA